MMDEFRSELEILINTRSMENGSDTPDFVLATYLVACLAAFDAAVVARDKFFGFQAFPDATVEPPPG